MSMKVSLVAIGSQETAELLCLPCFAQADKDGLGELNLFYEGDLWDTVFEPEDWPRHCSRCGRPLDTSDVLRTAIWGKEEDLKEKGDKEDIDDH